VKLSFSFLKELETCYPFGKSGGGVVFFCIPAPLRPCIVC